MSHIEEVKYRIYSIKRPGVYFKLGIVDWRLFYTRSLLELFFHEAINGFPSFLFADITRSVISSAYLCV